MQSARCTVSAEAPFIPSNWLKEEPGALGTISAVLGVLAVIRNTEDHIK